MKYEMVIFDADETLFDYSLAESMSLEKVLNDFGIEYSEEIHLSLYFTIASAIWDEYQDGQIDQKELKIKTFGKFAEMLHLDLDVEEFTRRYMYYLRHSSYLVDSASSVIKKMYGKCNLMIISNGLDGIQKTRIQESEIYKYFDEIVISEDVGVKKPNPDIFSYALEKYNNLDKSKILMVGDGLSTDIKGGHNYGLDTCWFNPRYNKNFGDIKPTYEINSLSDLEKILDA